MAPVREKRPRGFIVNPPSFALEQALRPPLSDSGRLALARPMRCEWRVVLTSARDPEHTDLDVDETHARALASKLCSGR